MTNLATKITTDKEMINELSNKIKSFGYPVYLSENGNYGFGYGQLVCLCCYPLALV